MSESGCPNVSVCPSGLRGYVQVVMYSYSWVQIPQLTFCCATQPPKTTKHRKTTQEKTHAPPHNEYECPVPFAAPTVSLLYTHRNPHTSTVVCEYAFHYLDSNRLHRQSPISILLPSTLVSTVHFTEHDPHLLPYGTDHNVLATML